MSWLLMLLRVASDPPHLAKPSNSVAGALSSAIADMIIKRGGTRILSDDPLLATIREASPVGSWNGKKGVPYYSSSKAVITTLPTCAARGTGHRTPDSAARNLTQLVTGVPR